MGDDRIPTSNYLQSCRSEPLIQNLLVMADFHVECDILPHPLECTLLEEAEEPGAGLVFSVSPTALEPAYG